MAGILKPESDERQYRTLILENQLTVILISDSETLSAAGALAICSGNLQDHPDVQGLAHFLEHMLFLGNKKFPEASGFHKFCSQNAGYCNAWTGMDRTVYHFLVSCGNLRGALDQFSGFFTCPLLTEELADRELHAIDSENNQNLQDDVKREFQLLRSTAKAGHPIQRFGTGNFKSLRDIPRESETNVRELLIRFYRECYSSNIMKLCIVGREDLDSLESMAREYFSDIPNYDISPLRGVCDLGDAFDAGWKQFYRIVPVKERRQLVLYFPTPPIFETYLSKPLRLLSFCIGHEGPGSILSYLKREGWATELSAGPSLQSTQFSLFEVRIKLTQAGLPHFADAAAAVLAYLRVTLRCAAPADLIRVREELAAVAALGFRFRAHAREDQLAEQLAVNLTRYPPHHALCGPEVFLAPLDPAEVASLLDHYLVATNLRVHLVAPEADQAPQSPSAPPLRWEQEEWYGARFARCPLAQAGLHLLAEYGGSSADPAALGLHLPPANPFVPTRCDIKRGEDEGKPSRLDVAGADAWHLLDTHWGLPKAAAQVQLTNEVCDRGVREAVGLRLALELLKEVTNEEAYQAREAGLIMSVHNTGADGAPIAGLRLVWHGYDDRLPALAARTAAQLAALDPVGAHESAFFRVREATAADYRNRRIRPAWVHADAAARRLLERPFFSDEERGVCVETFAPIELAAFLTEFLSSLRVVALAVGNHTRADAEGLVVGVLAALGSIQSVPAERAPAGRAARLPPGRLVLHEQCGPDSSAVDSAVAVWLECGAAGNPARDAALEVLAQAANRSAFARLRTEEQLGYVVGAELRRRGGGAWLVVRVQSVQSPARVDARIEAWLAAFGVWLLSPAADAEVAAHAASLAARKRDHDRGADLLCIRLMAEVARARRDGNEEPMFDRRDREAAALDLLRREDLEHLWLAHLTAGTVSRCKLSCHVVGKLAGEAALAEDNGDVIACSCERVLIFEGGQDPFVATAQARPPSAVATGAPAAVALDDFRGEARLFDLPP